VEYEQQTGIDLAKHPLADRLQNCNSVEDITAVFREQAQDIKKFQEKDKVLKPLKKVLTILHLLSSVPGIAQHVGLVRPKPLTDIYVSDPHHTACRARESNTDWPRCPTLCKRLSPPSAHIRNI
jgi:hypothetical protein